jgi:2-keto-4-pentenoate hydratase
MSAPEPQRAAPAFDPTKAARQLVAARLAGRALANFPGPLPPDMAAGYACQDAALSLWPDEVAGWKVGRIDEGLQAELGAARVMGPVFRRHLWPAGETPTPLPVIAGGFAAVEAEYVYRIGEDAPAHRTSWAPSDAVMMVEEALVGVEFAGSPLASINILGPRVVAADFGNNAGLILGPAIPDWRGRTPAWPPCEVRIDGELVGRGASSAVPGGPEAALAFLMGACAERGRPLRRGQLVTTGAISGVHDIRPGQHARIVFEGLGEIGCRAEPARPAAGVQGVSDEQRDHAG